MPISPIDFIHPDDQAALDNLKSIPLFTQCMQGFMKVLPERVLRGLSMAQKVRLGPGQLPEIYQYLPPACETLGIALPEFYLEMNPMPNAYTYGDQQVFITVTSGLLDALEEDEIRAVIGHECGHIACKHVLYHTMASMLLQTGSAIFGAVAAISMPVQFGLLYWMRRSELSADRAASLVMRDATPVVQTMIRLAGGPKSITEKINLELYIEQANEYDQMKESNWDKLLQGLQVMGQDHPLLAVRTREILAWSNSEQFQRLLHGLNGTGDDAVCPSCGQPVNKEWKFCRQCGAANPHYIETSHV